jgi:hypothetical protein
MFTTDCSKNRFTTCNESQNNNPFTSKNESRYAKPATDGSNNRFTTLDESQNNNPFASKNESNESNESKYAKPMSTRWSNLSSEEEERMCDSPRNTFQKRRSNFGPDKDKYGNYRKPTFRKETRPKTPPPPTFDFKEGDFPSLG